MQVRSASATISERPSQVGQGNELVSPRGDVGLSVSPAALSRTKRIADVGLSLIAGALLLPLLFLIAAIIYWETRASVLYSQRRIGLNGRQFTCLKFRTMVPDADVVLRDYLASNEAARQEWASTFKLRKDPRCTRIGRILRKTSLDELPQLYNVLRGDMSLVGPRPIIEAETRYYGEHFRTYCSVRPGVTGLWQVSGRSDTTYAERVALDVTYVSTWSNRLDAFIIVRTIKAVVSGAGSY